LAKLWPEAKKHSALKMPNAQKRQGGYRSGTEAKQPSANNAHGECNAKRHQKLNYRSYNHHKKHGSKADRERKHPQTPKDFIS
jgi:hypothetical protein